MNWDLDCLQILTAHKDYCHLTLGSCIGLSKTYELLLLTYPGSRYRNHYKEFTTACNLVCPHMQGFRDGSQSHKFACGAPRIPTLQDFLPGIPPEMIWIADHVRLSKGSIVVLVKASQEASYARPPLVFCMKNGSRISFRELVTFCSMIVPQPLALVTDNNILWYGDDGLHCLNDALKYCSLANMMLLNHNYGIAFPLQKKVERAVRIAKRLLNIK
jgi:hypothetical protein